MKPKNTETVSMRIAEDFSKVSEVEINGLRYTRVGDAAAQELLEACKAEPKNPNYWLTIFLPRDITWECADGSIRTRRTTTGKVIMSARKCRGCAETWLSAARNVMAGTVKA